MAGHNKWSKIKHTKGAVDAKRSKLFSKLSKEIAISARDGGGDPDLNARLRTAIQNAKTQNVPNDNIDRAIKKGTGELGGQAIEEVTYEGYAPGGIAVIVEVSTDNKNRSASEIRNAFSKNNGNLGTTGSVTHLFERKGEIHIPSTACSEEDIFEKALEAGAQDIQTLDESESYCITTEPAQLYAVLKKLQEQGLPSTSQQLAYHAISNIQIDDLDTATQILKLYDALENYEDTLNVFANFDIAEGLLEQITL